MLPDFNRLRVFYHVYLQQSSTGAAKMLHITQSGVSQQIKKLENELETALFTRMNRRLIPTSAGDRLFKVVQSFVDELEVGVKELQTGKEYPVGNLRIGAPEEFGKRYLPAIMSRFNLEYPEVTFNLQLGGPLFLFEQMQLGNLDLVYGDILPIKLKNIGGENSFEITPLIRERLVLACSRSYRDKWNVEPEYEKLCKLDYIGYRTDIALFRSWFDLHFKKAPDNLKLQLVVDNVDAIIQGLLNDMGVGITASHFISDHLNSGRLVLLGHQEKYLENTVASIRHRQRQPTVTEEFFHRFLVKSIQHLPELDVYL
ncbi:MAG: LysR family transcriptional regulator [Desulfotalea sp.]